MYVTFRVYDGSIARCPSCNREVKNLAQWRTADRSVLGFYDDGIHILLGYFCTVVRFIPPIMYDIVLPLLYEICSF